MDQLQGFQKHFVAQSSRAPALKPPPLGLQLLEKESHWAFSNSPWPSTEARTWRHTLGSALRFAPPSPACTHCPSPAGLSVVPAGAAGMAAHLEVPDQLLGLDLNVHLVFALVPLEQLLIG